MSRDSFLSRWSRRKAEAREKERQEETLALSLDDAPEETAAPALADPECPPAAAPTAEDDEPLELPDIDSLTADSDYTVFLRDKVPAALRKQALRKLWRSDPVLANLDGLNDYDEDFRNPAVTGAAVRTAYNALRGYARPEDDEVIEKPEDRPDSREANAAGGDGHQEIDGAPQQGGDLPSSSSDGNEDMKERSEDREEPDKA